MKYFRKIRDFNLKPNRITYNTLLDVSVRTEKMSNALSLIEEMHKDDILPDSYTYTIILNGLKLNNSSQNLVKLCLENIKKVVVADEIKHDVGLFNSLLDVS